MSNRIVSIVLRGDVKGFIGPMTAAEASASNLHKRMIANTKEAEAYRQNLTALGSSAGKFGLVAAAGVGLAVRAFANFDEAMSAVAATGDDAKQSIDALREAAIEAGARTKFSATEAAEAIENLAKAGVSASDVLGGGLDGALDLAAAGGLGVAEAAEIAATAMNQFKLSGEDVPHIADLLAAAAGKAMGEVSDMGAAFKYVGPVAQQLGVSIEETAGTIALLAQNGVLGDQAGTSLRGMLTSLTSPSKIAAKTMGELGISMYDAQGEFVGLEGLAGQLQVRLGGLGEAERNAALGRMFGNEQITAARILYSGGADAVRTWTREVNDQGFAADMAAQKMDNLKGDLEQLGGALETALIGTGEGANGPLRELVQLLSTLVDGYNNLPGPIKNLMLAGAGLTAVVGGTAFAATRAISAYSDLRGNLTEVGASFNKARAQAIGLRAGAAIAGAGLTALSGPAHEADEALGDLVDTAAAAAFGFAVGGPWGAAIGGGIAMLSSFGGQSAAAAAAQKELDSAGKRVADTLDAQTGALTDLTRATAAKELADAGVLRAAKDMGISLQSTLDAALGNEDALKKVTAASEGWADARAKSGNYTEKEEGALKLFRNGIGATTEAIEEQRKKTGEVKEATGGLSAEFDGVGTSAEDAADQVKSLTDALDLMLDPLLSQDAAMVEWKRSIQSLTADLVKNGGSLDSNTKAGQDNRDMIRDRVQKLKESAQADLDAGGSQDKFASKLKRGAEQILAAGRAANISEKDMRGYLKQLNLTPDEIDTLIEAQDNASPTVDGVQNKLNDLSGVYTAIINVAQTGANIGSLLGQLREARKGGGAFTGLRVPEGYASGGKVPGTPPSDPTRDNVLAMGATTGSFLKVRSGEWIINQQQSEKNDKWLAAINAGLNIDDIITGYASGGRVSRLDILRQQQTVRDLERSLVEREEYGKKRKGKRRPTRLVLKKGSLDRRVALEELAAAKKELRDLKSGKAAKDEAREELASQRADRESNRLSAKSDFSSNFDIGSSMSTAAVDRKLERMIADSTTFVALLSDLKRKGASPWLLAQLAEAGPTPGAIRLARQYSTDSAALARVNAQARQIDSISNSYSQLVTNPAFSAPRAWNSGISPTVPAVPVTASLVGAEIAVGTDGLMRFVKGQIVMSQDSQQIDFRMATT